MAYDAMHHQAVMFGGLGPGLLHDTWVWDGTNWTQVTPQTSPSQQFGRVGHAMAYDSAHGQVVLFGGETVKVQVLNDSWVWDGANWTQKSPQNSPPARYFTAMAFDSTHGQVVLFGGQNTSGTVFGDTWVWDGTNWTQKSPQNSPPARQGHAMAYDSTHGQVVLYGGVATDGSTLLGDTWTWDGANWTQQSPKTSPQARNAPAMSYDAMHDQTVLFGGYAGSYVADTWTWIGAPQHPPSQVNQGGIVSAADGNLPATAGGIAALYGTNLATGVFAATTLPLTTALDPMANTTVNVRTISSSGSVAAAVAGNDGAVAATIGPIAAPLFFVSPNQIDFQMPWEFVGQSQVSVTVTAFGATSSPVTISLANPSPVIFSINQQGTGQGVIQIANTTTFVAPAGSIPGAQAQPATAGNYLTIYCTGLGDVSNRPGDGAASPSSPLAQTVLAPTVSIGGVDAPVSFSGLTPGFVGLYQVNVQVPTGIPAGDAVPLIITIGGVKSNTVTIAVQ